MGSTHFLFRQGKVYHFDMPLYRIYTSVGYWMSFVFAWVLPQPSWRQMKSTPHFLLYNNQRSGVGLDYMLIWKRES